VSQQSPTFSTEGDLLQVQPADFNRYENEQLAALAVYSIYWLRKWGLRPTLETIAVLNHRLFPRRFSMDLFSEYPDANRTLRSLLQSGPKYRGWLSGSNRRGYAITPKGQVLVQELLRRVGYPKVGDVVLGRPTEAPRKRNTSSRQRARDVDFAAEIGKLRTTKLFQRWRSGTLQDRDLIHVYSALGVFDHTPAAAKALRLRDLQDSARKANDQEAEAMLRAVADAFPKLFSDHFSS
jgi:hypothetical protein